MISRSVAVLLAALAWTDLAAAQEDRILLADGKKIEGVKVTAFDVRELRYAKGGNNESVATDQVQTVELGKFKDVYRRDDPDSMVTVARDQLQAKNAVMAQIGMLRAAEGFLDAGKAQEGIGTLDEIAKSFPEGGVLPDVFRRKFEYYMASGAKGAPSAKKVADKFLADSRGGAWPGGLQVEAEFFVAMAERATGGTPKDLQAKLRGIVGKAMGSNPSVGNRANVQLANSLRETKEVDAAKRLYDEVLRKDNVDTNARAGAMLGLGQITMEQGTQADKEPYRQALLLFLGVRLKTRDAWPSLQAEAMYNAILAADKWRGPDYQYMMARCRGVLYNEFPDSEWTARAKAGR